MGGMGWHGHPGAGVGVSLGCGCALDGGTAPGPPQQPPEHRGRSSWDTAPGWAGLAVGVGGRRVGKCGDRSTSTRLGPIAVPGWGGDTLIPWVLVPELCPAQGGIILWHGAELLAPAPSHMGAVCARVPARGHPCALIPLHRSQDRGGGSGGTFLTSGFGL